MEFDKIQTTVDTLIGYTVIIVCFLLIYTVSPLVGIGIISLTVINKLSVFVLQKHLFGITIATGSSMQPRLPQGTKLTLEQYPTNITENTIITYYTPDAFIQHTVVSQSDTYVTATGTHNDTLSEEIPVDDIVSKTVTVNGTPVYIPVSPAAIRQTLQQNIRNHHNKSSENT